MRGSQSPGNEVKGEFVPRASLGMFVQDARSQKDQASLFGMLARYTRFVFLSKWMLGGFAVILLVSLIAWPFFAAQEGTRIALSGDGAAPGSSSAPAMFNPRYQGVDGNERQYTVTALKAIQQTKDIVLLDAVNAEMFFADQSWLTVTAQSGEFIDSAQRLRLNGNVTLTHANGNVIVTEHANIKLKENYAWGDGQVVGSGPTGKLLATGFEIMDNGAIMRFGKQGRVTVTIIRKTQ